MKCYLFTFNYTISNIFSIISWVLFVFSDSSNIMKPCFFLSCRSALCFVKYVTKHNFIEHSQIYGWKLNQRAEPIIIDFLRLYLSKKSDISWTTQRCSLPTSFKLFTDLPDTNDDLIDSSDESDHEIAADNDDSVQKFMK